jgi:hypothetical protein
MSIWWSFVFGCSVCILAAGVPVDGTFVKQQTDRGKGKSGLHYQDAVTIVKRGTHSSKVAMNKYLTGT